MLSIKRKRHNSDRREIWIVEARFSTHYYTHLVLLAFLKVMVVCFTGENWKFWMIFPTESKHVWSQFSKHMYLKGCWINGGKCWKYFISIGKCSVCVCVCLTDHFISYMSWLAVYSRARGNQRHTTISAQ